MAQTSLIIGDTNWAVKEDSLLGYNVIQNNYLPIPIDCVRATTATRVNEQGLIEIVPRNLLEYSEQFDNAYWPKADVTVSSNVTIAPNGTLTADKLIESATNSNHLLNRTGVTLNPLNASFYAKAGERNWTRLQTQNPFNGWVNVNLTTGALGQSGGFLTNIEVTNVGNGWWRISATNTNNSLSKGLQIFVIDSDRGGDSPSYLGDGTSGIFIWGAQLEQGSVATEYFPTTNRLDIPRIDYSTGTASLLVEPQRTNLALYSEQFNNDIGYISSGRPVITTNIAASPSGLLEADLLTYASGDSLRNTPSFTFTNAYTYSIFVKKGIGRYVTISGLFFTRSLSVGFDLDTKTCQAGGTVTDFGNGWLRLSISQVVTGDADKTGFFYVYAPNSLGVQDSAAGNRFYAWGCQIEEGTYPTSYIPTIASSVTRNADVISKTGVSGLIGQTEGTLFVDFIYNHNDFDVAEIISISDETTSNRVYIGNVFDDNLTCNVTTSSSLQFTSTTAFALVVGQRYKAAVSYKLNDFTFYVNGSQIATDNSGTVPLMSKLGFDSGAGASSFNKPTNSVQLYKTRLSNSELQLLTTI